VNAGLSATAGIILAAGESKRMGRPKALLPFRGGTFLSVLADTFQPFCDRVIAVFGFDGENAARLAPPGVEVAINTRYREGMLTSLQAGLRTAGLSADGTGPGAVLFTLVDHPAIRPATIAALVAADAPIAIPRMGDRRGHPVLMRREIAIEYLAEPSTAKVRDVIDRHADTIRYVPVDDPGINDDIDNPALYEALLAREALSV
jgi:CTP:molybdopterin cytidylyltransferase MocA